MTWEAPPQAAAPDPTPLPLLPLSPHARQNTPLRLCIRRQSPTTARGGRRMSDQRPPATRLTLIAALREGLRWEEFVALYGRLILYWGRRDFGLQEPDAENLCQDVLLKVWQGIRGYDPARGRFRS